MLKKLLVLVLADFLATGNAMTALAVELSLAAEKTTKEVEGNEVDLTEEEVIEFANGYGTLSTEGKNAEGGPITLWDGKVTAVARGSAEVNVTVSVDGITRIEDKPWRFYSRASVRRQRRSRDSGKL